MFALLQKSWAKQLKLGPDAQNLPLYPALILINAVIGVLIAWLTTVLNRPTALVILMIFTYLTLAFQHQTILRRWAMMPSVYRVAGWAVQVRYRGWIWLRLNPLTYAFIAFSVLLWVLATLAGRWDLLLTWLNLVAYALVYFSAKNWRSIWSSPPALVVTGGSDYCLSGSVRWSLAMAGPANFGLFVSSLGTRALSLA